MTGIGTEILRTIAQNDRLLEEGKSDSDLIIRWDGNCQYDSHSSNFVH